MNQVGLGATLGVLANALYWWALQPAWHWFVDRILPVEPLPFIGLGNQLAALHMHGVITKVDNT